MNRSLVLLTGIACCLSLLCSSATNAQERSSSPDAFVRVSERDPRYFELSDGSPYIPIGFCLVSTPAEDEFERILSTMAANRINYCRVWIDLPPLGVESDSSGWYNLDSSRKLERFLDLAKQNGVRVKMCLEYFRDCPPKQNRWSDKIIHNKANGGAFDSMEEFIDSEKGRDRFKRKLAFYQKRLGDCPTVFAWELWNEVDCVKGDWMAWTRVMLPELHRLFPKNLAVQSLGSYDLERKRKTYRALCEIKDNDVAQVHRYLDLGAAWEICHAPIDVLAADAVRELLAFQLDKPVILAETGAVKPRHSGCSDLYEKDRDGVILHDAIFAPFFAGAAGTGHTWWWRQCIEAQNQWRHFARFAEAVKGIDPPAEKFKPETVAHPRLRVYALQGENTLLLWCRDGENDWRSELERGIAPEELKNITVDASQQLNGRTVKSASAYDPWKDAWTKIEPKNGTLLLPSFKRSIVVKTEY